jgi:Mce-associated membrane protein
MTSSPNPTWYDVLGVSRDATPEQIKAAWRDATDKFEPGSGSGQFRMFNDAADVLLDPARRAAYDDWLGAAEAQAPEPEPAATRATALTEEPTVDGPATHEDRGSDEPPQPAETKASTNRVESYAVPRQAAPRTVANVVLALSIPVLLLLTVAALVMAGYFGLKVRTDARVADARDEAPATAERAAKAILEYDYRRLPADRKRASVYLTADFRKEYLENFTLLERQKDGTPGAAVQTKTVVTASVLGSGVMDAESDVVRVLVYVNQTSRKPGVDPQIFQNRVAMTMEKDGNRWLVDDLKSY